MRFSAREISTAAVFAALYATLVVAFSPISFGVIQLRVAGVLRPGIARMRVLAAAYALGVVVGNVVSPFAGVYELVFMPAASLSAGLAGYYLAKRIGGGYWLCGAVMGSSFPSASPGCWSSYSACP